MSLSSFFEKLVGGRTLAKNRSRISSALAAERERLEEVTKELAGEVRQNVQVSESTNRVLNNMTQAMIMLEANRGARTKA
ncbi:protein of unknown function [Pseudorhizobium banfieldiae]|uniref:Uncharacterized protein n=1 Tax=Pseudorhizobium banfieldiae TaxID=1125847 RepID=L0NDR0_9HYPH|nr:hypothetical protein [Pseudorhizobium banfieldiae]CAD6606318.1 hypothetical protein RNT25_01840 [arsenite-oxidising bacterium NT-25]CCF19185.1 protein of unknown function [Pseudorhizobium banfieldiae]